MALKKTVISPHGFTADAAYHRVEGASVSKSRMNFQVMSYKDNSCSSYFANAPFECAYDIAGTNPIKQAYEHLKTLPEFAGATDC